MSEAIDCGPVIIGAGAVGLAIAAKLSETHPDTVVLEAEGVFGHHTSSRNSEVIHSGIYYTPNSLKSNLCLRGKVLLYDFLEKYNIPYNRCGKLIVSDNSDNENLQLDALMKNADTVGVTYKLLSCEQAKVIAPLNDCRAILIPDTGYFDSHEFMKKLAGVIADNGGVTSYKSKVTSINECGRGWEISLEGQPFKIRTNVIINAAGLFADRVAQLAGFEKYKIFFYKGEYYKTNKIRDLKHLIYSVPPADQMSLGIHTRHYMDGSVGFGPNAFSVADVDYSIDSSRKDEFLRDISKYLSIKLSEDDIYPDYTGIRPKVNSGGIKADFIINKEICNDDRTMISLIGIESPGLTCSLAIAEHVQTMIQ